MLRQSVLAVLILSVVLFFSVAEVKGNTISVYWDNFNNPVFNGQLNVSTAAGVQGACIFNYTNPQVTVLRLCLNIFRNDVVRWVTPSNVPSGGFGIQAMTSDYQTPIFQWENVLLPRQMTGQVISTTGVEQSVQLTFTDGGVFYYRDVNRTNPLNGGMYGVVYVSQDTRDPGGASGEQIYGDVLGWFVFVLLWLSIIGALCTIITFTLFPKIRTYPIKLIMYLCVCIIVGFLAFLLAFEDTFINNSGLCFVTGLTVHTFFLANFCWTFCIAFNFYQMIVRRNREPKALEKWYHLGSWGIPIFCLLFVACFQRYGNRGGVCYITDALFIFLFFFTPGLIIISANAILFFFVAKEIHETLASAPKTNKRERRKELKVYISIFISIGLSWIFGFLMVLFSFETVLRLIFLTLFSLTTPLQGFFIFLSYCFNLRVLGCYCGLIGKVIPIFRRWENLDTRTQTSTGSKSGSSRTSSRAASSGRRGSTNTGGASSRNSGIDTDFSADVTASTLSRGPDMEPNDDDDDDDVFKHDNDNSEKDSDDVFKASDDEDDGEGRGINI